MLEIGVQTKECIDNANPAEGFKMLSELGFLAVDFSLNDFLKNTNIYQGEKNTFFDQTIEELKAYFSPHKQAAKEAGIRIHQMHMPYPIYNPLGKEEMNVYMREVVAQKSLEICHFLECSYLVVHGFKAKQYVGSEAAEWQLTEQFLESLAPKAKELGITLCIENLYDNIKGHLVEGPCCNAELAAERIDRLNAKFQAEVFGFCFDTGHANIVGIDPEHFLTTLGHRLKVLHIHDNDGQLDLHQIPFTFTKSRTNNSSTDWEGFLQGLRNCNFNGVLSFETAPVLMAFPKPLKIDALRLIAQIGKYFSESIEL